MIKNKTARLLVVEGCPLVPGDNPGKGEPPFSEDLLSRIKANPQFQLWQRLGWVKIKLTVPPTVAEPTQVSPVEQQVEVPPTVAEPTPAAEPEDHAYPEHLTDMGVAEARTVILHCTDPERLLDWHEADERKTIKEWCAKRIERLEASMAE